MIKYSDRGLVKKGNISKLFDILYITTTTSTAIWGLGIGLLLIRIRIYDVMNLQLDNSVAIEFCTKKGG